MTKKSKAHEANVNTTDLDIPQTMQLDAPPAEPIQNDEAPPLFKDEVRNEIFAKRRSMLEAEVEKQDVDAGIEKPAEETETEDETVAQSEEITPASAASLPEPAAGSHPEETLLPEKIKLKVEGKIIEVDGDTLTTLAQKGLSSDQRYNEAAKMKQDAQREREEAQRLMFSMNNPQPQAAPQNTPQGPEPILAKEKVADIVKRMNYGSEEEQASALLELGAAIADKGRPQGLPNDQVIQQATQNAVATIRFEQDKATIAAEFPEIFADKYLTIAAGTRAKDLMDHAVQNREQKSVIDIWRSALSEVKDKYIPAAPAPQTPTASTAPAAPQVINMDNRVERKRAAPKLPAGLNKVVEMPNSNAGYNPSSIVNQMRKARGQPVMT